MDIKVIDIRRLREGVTAPGKPALKQKDLAAMVGVQQSVISRVEKDPSTLSLELLVKICTALGIELTDALSGVMPGHGLTVRTQDPFQYGDLRALAEQLRTQLGDGGVAAEDADSDLPGGSNIRNLTSLFTRKPRVVITGPFDAGKSTLINLLLGDADLAKVSYSPTTAVVTYLRHLDDRPEWCHGEVLILDEGFEPESWDDRSHVHEHLVAEGDLHLLKTKGVHEMGRYATSRAAGFALVFHQGNILKNCTLVDTPGDGNGDVDASVTRKASTGERTTDVLIYMSPYTGFFGEAQMLEFQQRLRSVADIGAESLAKNLFVLISHASPGAICDAEVEDVLDCAAHRFSDRLEKLLSPAGDETTAPVATVDGGTTEGERRLRALASVLRTRMFAFYRGTDPAGQGPLRSRGQGFLDDLADLLNCRLPQIHRDLVERQVLDYTGEARTHLLGESEMLATLEEQASNPGVSLEDLRQQADAMHEFIGEFNANLDTEIAAHQQASAAAVDGIFAKECSEGHIKRLIKRDYSDKAMKSRSEADRKKGKKKLAQEEVAALVLQRVGAAVERDLEKRAGQFGDALTGELDSLRIKFKEVAGPTPIGIPMDLNGAFIGGAMSTVAVGALAMWASTLGNLGAYIIAAQAAGWLATLGISLPAGGATLTAAMAAFGGPVGVAVAIIAIGVLAGLAFRGDWETRLAKRLSSTLQEEGKKRVKTTIKNSVRTFWEDTKASVRAGADGMDQQVRDELVRYTELIHPDQTAARARRRARIERATAWITWLEARFDSRPPSLM